METEILRIFIKILQSCWRYKFEIIYFICALATVAFAICFFYSAIWIDYNNKYSFDRFLLVALVFGCISYFCYRRKKEKSRNYPDLVILPAIVFGIFMGYAMVNELAEKLSVQEKNMLKIQEEYDQLMEKSRKSIKSGKNDFELFIKENLVNIKKHQLKQLIKDEISKQQLLLKKDNEEILEQLHTIKKQTISVSQKKKQIEPLIKKGRENNQKHDELKDMYKMLENSN